MDQGQISDIIRWKKDNYMIQKVFDRAGNLHLQIMKIPYTNLHYTPSFHKKKSFQLTSNNNTDYKGAQEEGFDQSNFNYFHDLGASPEGRIWI